MPISKAVTPIRLFRSEFMVATVESKLAPPPSSDQYQFLSKQEQADIDYEKYRHSDKILIFGGIDENNKVSNKVLQLEFFQNKLLSKFRERMSSLVSMKYVQMQQQKNERRDGSPGKVAEWAFVGWEELMALEKISVLKSKRAYNYLNWFNVLDWLFKLKLKIIIFVNL